MKNEKRTRTDVLRAVALVISMLSLVSCNGASEPSGVSPPTGAEPPNILLIVADDMGYSDIGSFGGEIATPALDSLAVEGLQLTGFHVMPSCSPSRSILLSGVDNHRAGLGAMGERSTPEMKETPGYEGFLNFDVATLPELLGAGGYHTYMVGKWHLGHDSETSPYARGFEETFILVGGGGSHWNDRKPVSPSLPMLYQRNGKPVDSLPEDFYSTKNYTDNVLRWMRKNQGDGKPFFAYLAYTAPHDPLHAPEEYIDKYKGRYDGGWDVLREERFQALKDLGIIDQGASPGLRKLGSFDFPIPYYLAPAKCGRFSGQAGPEAVERLFQRLGGRQG